MHLITLADGRTVDIDVNPVLEAGYALLKDNQAVADFLKDNKAALQAYLVLRDDDWFMPDGERFLIGSICYSTLLTRIRSAEDEHHKKLWWDAAFDKDGYDFELIEKFVAIMETAGWKRETFGTTFKP
ncbi:hypothetical protein [Rhizobium sp. MHM7A]|uniref:hypothetical protein n=1 Tax=Rhizobium sp. MHM7A TaxID=2583233 RepID=UPI001105E0BD|nr:hypothetical protein [Rhizobium sp. MHM7A]TLX15904.1 hypothetical protein FFR93_00900 [Rhizobium sp. MHM7A]